MTVFDEQSASSSRTAIEPEAERNQKQKPVTSVATCPECGAELPLSGASAREDDVALGLPRPSGVLSLAVLGLVAVALGLGLALGFLLFGGGGTTQVVREVVELPAPVVPDDPIPPAPTDEPEPPAVEVSAGALEPEPPTSAARGGKASSKVPSSRAGTNEPEGSSSAPAAGELESAQIDAAVARYAPSVKRHCWQPALDARDPGAPPTARVLVTLTIGPDGAVKSVNADSEPRGYPGLRSCIVQRVKTWTFPPSSGTTTVNVPFVFAAQ